MIREFSVSPKPQNKNAKIVVLISLIVAALSFATRIVLDKYNWAWELLAFFAVVVTVYISSKYIFTVYYYDIMIDTDGVPIFVVRKMIGRRQETHARVELTYITECTPVTREERKKHKTPEGVLKFNYCPTLWPARLARLGYESPEQRAELYLELSDEFCELLLSYSDEARLDGSQGV